MRSGEERNEAKHEQSRAGQVERVAPVLDLLVERDHEQRGRGDSRRHVDEEDPAPGEIVDDDPAEQRADEPRDAPHRPEDSLHARALLEVVDVADDGERGGLHRSRPQSLQSAEADERADAAREPAGHRTGEEDGDAGEQHRLATVEIGELAVEGHRDGRGQQIGGEDPGIEVDAAQVADHGGHGGGDDGHFHGRHRQAEQQRNHGERPIGLHRGNPSWAGTGPAGRAFDPSDELTAA